MGAGSGNNTLRNILEKAKERLKTFCNYYINKGEIQKTNEYFIEHSIIILLALREIELIKKFLDPDNESEVIYIPQYSFKYKKVYSFKFRKPNLQDKIIVNLKKELNEIKNQLEELIDTDICEYFDVSVLDDLYCPDEVNDLLIKIIEESYKSKFHEFYLGYVNDFIKLKMDRQNIYSKDALENLKFVKYITQILILIKIFIKFNKEDKGKLTQDEKQDCKQNIFYEEIIFTNFVLYELSTEQKVFETDKIKENNELVLDELVELYKKILNLVDKIEVRISY